MAESHEKIEKQSEVIKQEKEKSEQLLLNILPYEIAEELKSKGRADVRRYNCASVLFADIKGFTKASQVMEAEEVVKTLEAYFSKFDEILSKHQIEKIKTIGDAYMCAGGLPIPNKSNPIDLVLTALEMQKFIQDKKENKLEFLEHIPSWELRIGIHTGALIAGVIGKKKFAYDVWGDTVNTASRMESCGEVGKINISEATYQLIKDFFVCEERGELEVKGKGKIPMY